MSKSSCPTACQPINRKASNLRQFLPAALLFARMTAAVLPFVQPTMVHGAHYYVANSGNDSNAGSLAHPWRTVQHSANQMGPGDSVTVADGIYPEVVQSQVNGAPASPISFVANSTNTIIYGFTINHSHHSIIGFTLTGQTVRPYAGVIWIGSGASFLAIQRNIFSSNPENVYQLSCILDGPGTCGVHNITIENNAFLNTDSTAVNLYGSGHLISSNFFTSPYGGDMIRLFASQTTISDNYVTNWSNLAHNRSTPNLFQSFSNNGEIASNNIIENNIAVNCFDAEIGNIEENHMGNNVRNWVWRNNVFANVMWALNIFAPGMEFYNNTFYASGLNSVGPLLFRSAENVGSADSARVYNNIFSQGGVDSTSPNEGWYYVEHSVNDFQADYNAVFGSGSGASKIGFQVNGREEHGLNGNDPEFTDPSDLDFTITQTSPCSGSGLDLGSLFATDITGQIRNKPWSIGAYQQTIIPASKPQLTLTSNSQPLTSGTYYVTTNGNDLNAGTQIQPWKTIQHAANLAQAGSTIIVGEGLYPEIVTTHNAGTPTKPILFQGLSTNTTVFGFSVANPYQQISGFTITGQTVRQYAASVWINPGGDGLLVSSNIFASSPANVYQLNCAARAGLCNVTNITVVANSFINGNNNALNLYGSGHLVVSNFFSSTNGWDMIDWFASNSRIANNYITNWSNLIGNPNHPDLLQTFSLNGEIATNNIIEGNFAINCYNVQIGNIEQDNTTNIGDWIWRNNVYANVGWAMSICAPSMQFYNNTFYKCGQNTFGPILFRNIPSVGTANSGRVYNNIFYRCGIDPSSVDMGWYLRESSVLDFEADYNIVTGIGAGTSKAGLRVNGLEAHGINGKYPNFVNQTQGDFSLQAPSPCLGAGIDLDTLFTTDITGATRTAPWSIGAYQQ